MGLREVEHGFSSFFCQIFAIFESEKMLKLTFFEIFSNRASPKEAYGEQENNFFSKVDCAIKFFIAPFSDF